MIFSYIKWDKKELRVSKSAIGALKYYFLEGMARQKNAILARFSEKFACGQGQIQDLVPVLAAGKIFKKQPKTRRFQAVFGKLWPKNAFFRRALPAFFAFRKVLGSVGQKWISFLKSTTGGIICHEVWFKFLMRLRSIVFVKMISQSIFSQPNIFIVETIPRY